MLAGIKRGRLSAAEVAEMERLAETLKNPTPSAIARRMSRHPATIAWRMMKAGLLERQIVYVEARPGKRKNGTVQHRYTREEDERLVELRRARKSYREIAEALTAEFGKPRNMHSVQVRNTMLSAYEGGPEA